MIKLNESLINEVKDYIRVDEEDTSTDSIINACVVYFNNAGIKYSDEMAQNSLYKLGMKMLAAHWNENRGALVNGSINKTMEISLNSIITQLKFCYESSD